MNDLLARAIAAHGGLDRWNKFNGTLFNFDVLKDARCYPMTSSGSTLFWCSNSSSITSNMGVKNLY
jgi:hypothetical protein